MRKRTIWKMSAIMAVCGLVFAMFLTGCTWDNGNGDDSPNVISPPGNTIAERLDWIRNNARNNSSFIIDVSIGENIGSQNLYFGGMTVGITLRGTGTMRTVGLSGNGSLFTVGSGVTLTLDRNITLQGRQGNNASLVQVESGGTLVMEVGSVITDNVASGFGGGVAVANGGTFTMYGGTIHGNTATGYDWGSQGGGVFIGPDGTFVMHGGRISDNTASSSISWAQGGGVFINGTFTMLGGEISGNIATGHTFGQGGGVSIGCYFQALFVMRGGEISDNAAVSNGMDWANGGGVHVGGYNPAGGTFEMSDGTIFGDNIIRYVGNMGGSNSALIVGTYGANSATARHGTFSPAGVFTALGNLPSSNHTVEVRNGVLQGAITITITGIPSVYVGLLGVLFMMCPSDWGDFNSSTATITGSSASFVFLGVNPGSFDIQFALFLPGDSYDFVMSYTIFSEFVTVGTNPIPFSVFHYGRRDGYIPAQWQGTFGTPPQTLTLHADGRITWTGWTFSVMPSGSRSGVTIMPGGAGGSAALGITAQWVYVAINGVREGIIVYFTPDVSGYQQLIGMGQWGANYVLNMVGTMGGALFPQPNISGFPGFPTVGEGLWYAR